MSAEPFSVYNTWGYHDELGDQVELTERLALNALKALERWKEEFGLSYEYFLLDYGWFDPRKGFDRFHPQRWPKGPERFLRRLAASGFTPGLWFSTNGAHLQVPAWKKSLCADRTHYSLVDGPFGDALEAAVLHAAEQWGVRYFKFDFAACAQGLASTPRSILETERLSRERFALIVARLRERFPDVRLIGHSGFWQGRNHERTGEPRRPTADPALLADLDHYLSNDPQIGEPPQLELCRARSLNQDWGLWRRHRDGFPLERIDDHGVMVGATNTCFYLGRRGFRRGHLAQLARGARRDLLCGNPALLTDADVTAILRQRQWFYAAWRQGLTTACVGSGEPGLAPWHGFLTGGGRSGLLYLVNPHWQSTLVELEVPGLQEAAVLFTDAPAGPAVSVQPGFLRLELGPEACVLLGLGEHAQRLPELQRRGDVRTPASMRLLSLQIEGEPQRRTARLAKTLEKGERLVVCARLTDAETGLPQRFAPQNTRERRRMKPQAHEVLRLRVRAKGRLLEAEGETPAVPVFCGVSWVVRRYATRGPADIELLVDDAVEGEVDLAAYAVRLP
ncbi:MAG: hypothetical protein ACFB20_03480 [Opitutales bacterium]